MSEDQLKEKVDLLHYEAANINAFWLLLFSSDFLSKWMVRKVERKIKRNEEFKRLRIKHEWHKNQQQ